jgi:hypothetical protein
MEFYQFRGHLKQPVGYHGHQHQTDASLGAFRVLLL